MNGKRIFICLLTVMLSSVFLGYAFGGEKEKVAAVFGGMVDDKSFNEAGYNGLKKAVDEGLIELTYTENCTTDQREEVFRNYARQGFDRIIGWGGEFQDAGVQVAKEFPKVQFLLYNSKIAENNVTSFQTPFFQVGYVAGTLAVHMSPKKKVAVVCGQAIPIVTDFTAGVERAIKDVDPNGQTKQAITGSWSDAQKAREMTLALIDAGYDFIIAANDQADAGIFSACEDHGVKTLGLYAGGEKMAPSVHVGYIEVGEPMIAYLAATSKLDGKLHWIGIKEGAVKPHYGDQVPQSVQVKVNEALRAAKEGKIKF